MRRVVSMFACAALVAVVFISMGEFIAPRADAQQPCDSMSPVSIDFGGGYGNDRLNYPWEQGRDQGSGDFYSQMLHSDSLDDFLNGNLTAVQFLEMVNAGK